MTAATEQIVKELEQANEALIAFLEACTEQDLKAAVPGDGWTVAADAHHCAVGHVLAAGWIGLMRRGEDVPGSKAAHDDANAKHANEFDQADPRETMALLRRNAAEATAVLKTLTPEEMGKTSMHGPAGGMSLTVAQMAGAFPNHVRAHLERMKHAVDGA